MLVSSKYIRYYLNYQLSLSLSLYNYDALYQFQQKFLLTQVALSKLQTID